MDLSQKLSIALTSAKMTNAQLAARLKLTQSSFNHRKRGKVKFKPNEIAAIQKILNLSNDDICDMFLKETAKEVDNE